MRILFVEPYDRTLFSFRKELLDELIRHGFEVVLCTTVTQKVIAEYQNKIFKLENVEMDLKNKSVFKNLDLKRKYKSLIKLYRPNLILSFSIKPNIYCGLHAKKIPMIANITGLGNMFKKKGILSSFVISLYRKAFKNVNYIFFQNQDGLAFFKQYKIPINNYQIIPGSGVNLKRFIPSNVGQSNEINFLFASRAIKEKGFNLLLKAIPLVLKEHKNVHFTFLSAEEDVLREQEAKDIFEKYNASLTLLARTDDMNLIYSQNDFVVLPSFYREGISNVLLESLACARPIITTKDNPGCMETLLDGVNGYGVKSNDLDSLIKALNKAASTPKEEIQKMGEEGRKFVSRFFDRRLVINTYLDIIKKLSAGKE